MGVGWEVRIFLDWVVGFEPGSPPNNYAREGMAGRVASKSSVECVNAVHGDHSSVVYGNIFTLVIRVHAAVSFANYGVTLTKRLKKIWEFACTLLLLVY